MRAILLLAVLLLASVACAAADQTGADHGDLAEGVAELKKYSCIACHGAFVTSNGKLTPAETGVLAVSGDYVLETGRCVNCHYNQASRSVIGNLSKSVHKNLGCICHSWGKAMSGTLEQPGYYGCDAGNHYAVSNKPGWASTTDFAFSYINNATLTKGYAIVFWRNRDASYVIDKEIHPLYYEWYTNTETITADTRYITCFNCHFITGNFTGGVAQIYGNPNGIGLPREVLDLINDPHAVKSLEEYGLAALPTTEMPGLPPIVPLMLALFVLTTGLLLAARAARSKRARTAALRLARALRTS